MAFDQTHTVALQAAATTLAADASTGSNTASVTGNDGRQYTVVSYPSAAGAFDALKRDFNRNAPGFFGPGIAPPNGGLVLVCDTSSEVFVIARIKK